MRVIPVLDVVNGVAVRAVAGPRSDYRPLVSKICATADPLDVAAAYRRLGYAELYLADLDAIAGAEPAWALYAELRQLGLALWLDAGLRGVEDALAVAAAGVEHIIVGLETVRGPAEVQAIVRQWDNRVVISLDLKDGRPLGSPIWGPDVEAIAERVIGFGATRLIVLDLARVGVGAGVGTEELCRRLATSFPQVELIVGGGVRDEGDLAPYGKWACRRRWWGRCCTRGCTLSSHTTVKGLARNERNRLPQPDDLPLQLSVFQPLFFERCRASSLEKAAGALRVAACPIRPPAIPAPR